MILFTSLVLPVESANAMTVPDFKLMSKIVRGIGEKIGVKWTDGALAATVGYIAGLDTPQGLSFVGKIPIMDGQIDLADDTIKHYKLDPPDWLDGVDLINDAGKVIVPDTRIPVVVNPFNYGDNSTRYLDICGLYATDKTYTSTVLREYFSSLYGGHRDLASSYDINTIASYYFQISSLGFYFKADGTNYFVPFDITENYIYNGVLHNATTPFNMYMPPGFSPTGNNIYDVCGLATVDYPVVSGDVVNISNVNTTIINNIDNSSVTNNITYVMDVIAPVGDPGSVAVPYNPPLTPEEVGDIYPPKDGDNDGIPDDTDITPGGEVPVPDDTGIFAKLFPILLIVKLFGVLGSCLMYLVRMFQFIMTIPGIDAIPIDNAAFVWFRSAQIVGIKIYDVVSSLAGVGLSFIVFRAIRRAYL
jgi:hypothetical protein